MFNKAGGLTPLFGWRLMSVVEFCLKFGHGWSIILGNTPAKPLNDAQIGGFFLPAVFVRQAVRESWNRRAICRKCILRH